MKTAIAIAVLALLAVAVFSVACTKTEPQTTGVADKGTGAAPSNPGTPDNPANSAGDATALDRNFDSYQGATSSTSAADQGPSDQDLALIG
jgi:hypothetical protein